MLVCDFGAPIRTRYNTYRFSVSFEDGQDSLNGATGVNWYTPSVLTDTLVLGNTLVTSNTIPVVETFPQAGSSYPGILLQQNAFLALGSIGPQWGAPAIDFSAVPPGIRLSGNQYWAAPAPLVLSFGSANYSSLAAFREATGQETGPGGEPTGSDADPGLATTGAFFQTCVDWQPRFPAIPNSPALDAIRGFSGC